MLSIFYIYSEIIRLFLAGWGCGVYPPPLIGDMSPEKSSFILRPPLGPGH